ncbi:MAG TPA: hypothetical protein VKR58_15075 [Aquella sp.]|nr:hypothetical protein [Aquella sp.]
MKQLAQNRIKNKGIEIILLGIIAIGIFPSCSSQGGDFFSNDKVKASFSDGSVEVVVNFLKKQYLNDPDSYKSIEWGKLIKHSDGSFTVTHRFSAKNGFGGVISETLTFYIYPDGQKVRINSESEEQQLERKDKAAEQEKADNEYIAKDFSNVLFEGTLTETIDGISEKYTFKGALTKVGREIQGDLEAIEKTTKYHLTGNIKEEGKVDFTLKNYSNGSTVQLEGIIVENTLFTNSTGTEFYIAHSN